MMNTVFQATGFNGPILINGKALTEVILKSWLFYDYEKEDRLIILIVIDTLNVILS